jgi:sortase A
VSAQALIPAKTYRAPHPSRRGKVLWTVGNLMMLIGVYLLLYVGGLFADEQFNLMAAQGGSDIALPDYAAASPAVTAQEDAADATTEGALTRPFTAPTAAPRGFTMPQLNNPGGGRELNTLPPSAVGNYGPSSVERILIPEIAQSTEAAVDRKVVEVGWTLEEQNGQQVAIWEVAKYAVGHHAGSANPGQSGNVVLAGHSGGRAYPFNDIYYLEPGDPIYLWSNGQQFQYTVSERHVLDEIGPNVTLEQRLRNAEFIEPTNFEVVTLVTCWPLTGPDKFNQRVVIRALPLRAQTQPTLQSSPDQPGGGWHMR